MKTWTVKYLPSGESWSGFEQGGFASYDEAYAWLRNNGFCPACKKSKQPDCIYEWMIFEKEEEENSLRITIERMP